MGFSLSWVAFKGLSKADALHRTGLRATGQKADDIVPDERSPFTFSMFPKGWSAIFSHDFRYAAAEGLGHLSANATVLGCQIEEHIMFSAAALFTDARETWRVAHDSNRDRYDLALSGTMPTDFEPIRQKLFEKQDHAGARSNVDYIFDVPIALAKALTGYRHDEWELAWGEPTYERLEVGF